MLLYGAYCCLEAQSGVKPSCAKVGERWRGRQSATYGVDVGGKGIAFNYDIAIKMCADKNVESKSKGVLNS